MIHRYRVDNHHCGVEMWNGKTRISPPKPATSQYVSYNKFKVVHRDKLRSQEPEMLPAIGSIKLGKGANNSADYVGGS